MPAAKAGSEPIVTLLPTVTEEMLMGTVPLIDAVTVLEIDAVTDPICAVPATNAGSVVSETACVAGKLDMLAVTLFPTVTVPPTVIALARSWVLVRDASVKVTACDAGKLRTETLPVTAPKVVDWEAGKLEIETTLPLTALRISVIA